MKDALETAPAPETNGKIKKANKAKIDHKAQTDRKVKAELKDRQLIIRVKGSERDAFVDLCDALDTSAAREIRRFMWDYVGIVRTTKRLERAMHRVNLLAQEVDEYYGNFRVTPDLIELRNLLEVARLIVRSALSRHESRGLHYNTDYPAMAKDAVDTVLVP